MYIYITYITDICTYTYVCIIHRNIVHYIIIFCKFHEIPGLAPPVFPRQQWCWAASPWDLCDDVPRLQAFDMCMNIHGKFENVLVFI